MHFVLCVAVLSVIIARPPHEPPAILSHTPEQTPGVYDGVWPQSWQGVQRSGKSQGNSIPGKSQGIVRDFVMGQGKLRMLWKVREFWTGHGYGGFMSNLKHFGQHPHSLLMELLASVTWMSSSCDTFDISLMSDKLIYNFLSNYTWKSFSSHETERVLAPLASRAASLMLLLEQ